MLALAGVDSLLLVGQKRYQGKTRSSSVGVREFCSQSGPGSFFICSLDIGFLLFLDYAGNVARFSEAFYKSSNEESEGGS